MNQSSIDLSEFELISTDGSVTVILEEGWSIRSTDVNYKTLHAEDPRAGEAYEDGGHSTIAQAEANIAFNLTGDVYYNEAKNMVATNIENVLETADGQKTGILPEVDEDGVVIIDASRQDIEHNRQ